MQNAEVRVRYVKAGPMGPGWYAWEAEYPEEGCIYFSSQGPPTNEKLKEISSSLVLEE